ncbi:hypothetical protein [Kineosporia succinea]|uniref:Uncharacterized protein n=1 Tax=Kineosporia succinea TaxID=84632 RepID=A0ABT9NXU6_9ACTN|nr:hypothetical protein [Kineosporia succinea]MDP9825259.1 hypothetical protein [Kineosporia succinea]
MPKYRIRDSVIKNRVLVAPFQNAADPDDLDQCQRLLADQIRLRRPYSPRGFLLEIDTRNGWITVATALA